MITNPGPPLAPKWATGRYYFLPNGVTSTSNALGNGSVRATQFYVPNTVTVTRLGCEVVTTVGETGSRIRLGIYRDLDGRPDALVLDAGAVAVDGSTGVKEATISQVLTPGFYWAASAAQGVATTPPTMRIVNSTPSQLTDVGTSAPTVSAPPLCWISGTTIATVGTALPDPFSPASQSTALAPRLFCKA